jgi:hypothetical protein
MDVNGKRLMGITFANLTPAQTVSAAIYAVTFRDAVVNNSATPPAGVGNASPSAVEQTRSTLLTVAVTPGTNPTSTGVTVTVDMSGLGGSASQTFYDDGTHGDAAAGNLVYSFATTISDSQSIGGYTLPFTINDAQGRSATGSIALSVTAWAWNETIDGGGDAGELPSSAQHTSGSGTLPGIRGTLNGNESDVYSINICDHASFSATTVGGSGVDTQLFLFDANGNGVTGDDDSAGGAQSTLSSAFLVADGQYYLAISGYDRDPVDGGGNELWLDTPFDLERQADGPGAGSPIVGWNGNGGGGGGYLIALTGVCRGDAVTCGSADFDCDGDTGTDFDIQAFFACLAGNCPAPPCPNNADFNGDGDVGTDADIEAFFRVLAGGHC